MRFRVLGDIVVEVDRGSVLALPLPQDDLREIMLVESAERGVREHAYYRYWLNVYKQTPLFSQDLLQDLLDTNQNMDALGGIVGKICVTEKIKLDDALWLQDKLPDDTFGYNQVRAFLLLHDPAISDLQKIDTMLTLKTDWATKKVISKLGRDHLAAAYTLVASSKRPKGAKHDLREALRCREAR